MRKRKYDCKNIEIEFHRTYLVMAFGFILTGYYLNLIVFTSLILVHELGHYLMARINKINVTKIVVYPYGGMTKIDDMINLDISKELLVATAGVIMQYLFYLLIGCCYQKGIIRGYTKVFRLANGILRRKSRSDGFQWTLPKKLRCLRFRPTYRKVP